MGYRGWIRNSVILVVFAVLFTYVPQLTRKQLPKAGGGFAAPGWRKVADAFRKNLDSGAEEGAAFALFYKGEMVVEFSGGYADVEAERAWSKDTLSQAFSSSKGLAAITMATLVDKELLDYTSPVARYWPEFVQNGKETITVEELLSHQAGLAVIDIQFSESEELKDPQKISDILAAQTPNWKPGSDIGYHGHTLGLYMNELVKRVDPKHRDLSTYFSEELAIPLGLDIYFGLPRHLNDDLTRVYELNLFSTQMFLATRYWPVIWTFATDPQSLTTRSIVNPSSGSCNSLNYQDIRNPSTHAFGRAESFAKLMGIVANGGQYRGKQVISPASVAKLTETLASGWDLILKMELSYGRGTTLRESPLGSTMFGTPGAGGQMVYGDAHHGLGWAYLTNHHSVYAIGDDPRYIRLEEAIYECVRGIESKSRKPG